MEKRGLIKKTKKREIYRRLLTVFYVRLVCTFFFRKGEK